MSEERFKAFEHAGWEAIPGRYDDAFGRLTTQVLPAMLEAARIGPGVRALDVCTGPGFAAEAARAAGAEVVGVDFAASMVERARRRHPDLEFRVGDAEALPFDDASFDAVLIAFGLLHLARPERALAEAHRVLRPGGRVAASVWAPPDRAIGFALVLEAVREHGRLDVELPPAPDFFLFSDPAHGRRAFEDAGFQEVTVREIAQTWTLGSGDELFENMRHATVRTAGLLQAQTPEALAAIRAALQAAVANHRSRNGFELPMPAVLTAAEKPRH